MTSNLLTASFLPGMMQFMVVAQCYVPAFKTPTGDPWFVFILPLLVWFGWFMFLNVRGWFRTNRRVMAAEGL
jgi:hypothetical protein